MRLYRPSALLLGATLVLGAVAAPSLAFADGGSSPSAGTTTQLTPAELRADLKAAAQTTSAAGAEGWTERVQSSAGNEKSTDQVTYAVMQGRGLIAESDPSAKEIDVQHRGSYESASAFGTSEAMVGVSVYMGPGGVQVATPAGPTDYRRVLGAIGRPHATWIYTPDPGLNLADPNTVYSAQSPSALLTELADTSDTSIPGTPSPTETVVQGGSTTYSFEGWFRDGGEIEADAGVGLTVNADGALTAFATSDPEEAESIAFTYGAQSIALPKASQVVSDALFQKGEALVTMRSDARMIAAATRKEVLGTKHKRSATVHLIRTDAAGLVAWLNSADGEHVFSRHNIRRGVRLTGTNPFTHATVVYTVTASGTKAIVHHE